MSEDGGKFNGITGTLNLVEGTDCVYEVDGHEGHASYWQRALGVDPVPGMLVKLTILARLVTDDERAEMVRDRDRILAARKALLAEAGYS